MISKYRPNAKGLCTGIGILHEFTQLETIRILEALMDALDDYFVQQTWW